MPSSSNRSNPGIQEGLSAFRRALGLASEIASKIERGLPFGPIGALLSSMRNDPERGPLGICILHADSWREDRLNSAELGGERSPFPSPEDSMVGALTRPTRGDGGDRVGSSRKGVDDAVMSADNAGQSGVTEGDQRGSALSHAEEGAARPEREDIIVTEVGLEVGHGPLAHRLALAGVVVVVAATEAGKESIAELLGGFSVAKPPWWIPFNGPERGLAETPRMPGTMPDLERLLGVGSDGLRSVAAAAREARRLEAVIEVMARLVEREVRSLETRQRVVKHREEALEARLLLDRERVGTMKAAINSLRTERDEFERRLKAELESSHKDRSLPASVGQRRIGHFLDDLPEDILTREKAGHALRVGVRADVSKTAFRILREQLREDFESDLARARVGLESEARTITGRVAEIRGATEPIAPSFPDGVGLWEEVEKRLHLDYQFEGEVLQRGVLDLIAQGWRLPRTALMLLSTFGIVAGPQGVLRAILGPVLIGSVAWAWLDLRRDRRHRIDRELRNVRKTLGNAMRSLYEQTPKEWHGRLVRDQIDRRKVMEDLAERRLRDWSRGSGNADEQHRLPLREERRSIEQRLHDLRYFPEPLRRARQAATEARRALEGALVDLITSWRDAGAGASA